MTSSRALLCILDGWGVRPTPAEDDATRAATFFWKFWEQNPHTLLAASEQAVGLPEGQFGNSEVGHTVIGLGRIPLQPLVRVDQALETKTLLASTAWQEAYQRARAHGASIHLWGLLSSGGTHSHLRHWQGLLKQFTEGDVPLVLHLVLDGRDVPPKTAQSFVNELMSEQPPHVRVASLCGRFFAMDRDQRWERTEDAYRLVAERNGYLEAPSWQAVFEDDYYTSLPSDEFMEPILVGEPFPTSPEDIFLSLNFRADRARQMIRALGDPTFKAFSRSTFPRFKSLFSFTNYSDDFSSFCSPLLTCEDATDSLGDVLSRHHKTQLRIAESEKYAHVTFFLNGGREQPFPGEDRTLIPSPKVTTYNEAPAMSAERITCEAIKALKAQSHDVIVVNYANADMLGHTGNFKATEQAVRVLDICLQHLVAEAQRNGYSLFVTADHGNAEMMLTIDQQPHASHTIHPVPFIILSPTKKSLSLREGTLADIAPTVLTCLGVPVPDAMKGRCLFSLVES